MKHLLLRAVVAMLRGVIRLYGWRNTPKPPPYDKDTRFPWWRPLTATKVQTSSFAGAFQECLWEMGKKIPKP